MYRQKIIQNCFRAYYNGSGRIRTVRTMPVKIEPILIAPARTVVAEQATSLKQEAPCGSWR